MKLILLGASGAGKGTVAKMLTAIDGSKILDQISDLQKLKSHFHRLSRTLQWRLYNIAKWEDIYNVDI